MYVCNTAELIKMPFGVLTRVGPRDHVLDGETDTPREGTICGEMSAHCKVRRLSAVSCAKTAVPIDMQFGKLSRVGPWNHVLHGMHTGATWLIFTTEPYVSGSIWPYLKLL